MEMSNDQILITNDISKDNNVNNVENDEEKVAGPTTLNNESEFERERKRKREEEAEQKRIRDEEYYEKLHEQRYKRLMHLLDKSQFYADFLMKKISQPPPQKLRIINDENKAPTPVDENKPPQRKREVNSQKYDIRRYISPKIEKKKSSRSKLNLSEEEIENELSTIDEPTVDNHKDTDIPKYFNGMLYEYQREGLNWLKLLYENGLNGILADEMGLGKTVQIIALLCHLIERRQGGPFLIVVPLSTMSNWILEFQKFAPSLPIIVFHGNKEKRTKLYKKIKKFHQIVQGYKTQPIVLTTFEMPLQESGFLKTQKWTYIIVDEGHRIKNHQCLLAKMLRTLHSMNRLLLTGTPLQNNLAELWSLLNFLLPEIFDDLAVFESWFDVNEMKTQNAEFTEKILKQEEEKRIIASLREILKPFVLRREKSNLHLNIPPKKEIIVYAPLTPLQCDLYKGVLNSDIHNRTVEDPILQTIDNKKPKRACVLRNASNDNTDINTQLPYEPSKSDKILAKWKQHIHITDQNRDYVLHLKYKSRWMAYKKIVNHPYLIYYPLDDYNFPKVDENIIKISGKFMVMDVLLKNLKSRGHKVLLFSTMTTLLDIIEDYLSLRDYIYVRLDGASNIEERGRDIKRFNTDPEVFLFLISTKAGGTGLNLAAADTVIIFDCDWNPQNDIQAMARCHRIGQTRPVVIYKLCTKGTVDEAIVVRARSKRILEKMVISKEMNKLDITNTDTLMQLKHLLETNDSKVITSTEEVFTEEALDELLDRNDMIEEQPVDVEQIIKSN